MNKNRFSASRRELLLGVGSIGIASLGAGVGTYAAFSDSERTGTIVTAGALDLRVHHESNYNGRSTDVTSGGTVDGGPGVLFELPAVKPGDSGRSRFCFELRTNPAYLWLCGELIANVEGGVTEPERNAEHPSEYETGELADAIDVTLKYADVAGNASETVVEGSLRTVLARLSDGIALDAAGRGDIQPGSQQAFVPEPSEESPVEPCLVFEWTIPESAGNEIQTDRVEFGLTFYAQQARHTDGTDNPCDNRAEDGDDDSDDDDTDDRQAISFVAVCADSELSPSDLMLSVTETNDEGEPLAVDWETSMEVDRVVLKTGGGRLGIENFPGGSSGTAAVGRGTGRIDGQTPSTPCPNGESRLKFEFDSQREVFVPE